MNNVALFLLSSLIWGSTWIMITFQLGSVSPLVSVVYRFSLASAILFSFCWFKKKEFSFSPNEHFYIFVQGLFLFGINYWLTYVGITKISSALAAILSTSIVYFNVVFARIFLRDKIKREVIMGATIGLIGIALIFIPQLDYSQSENEMILGIIIVLAGSIFASLGNIVSAKTQRLKIPVMQANALGMGYAALFLGVLAWLNNLEFSFEFSFKYIASLVYLSLFGSVIAFGAFLTLLGKVGPDKAGYISLVYPVIALVFSTLFESYSWNLMGLIGVLFILIGNFIAMGKANELPIIKRINQ